MSSNSVFCSYPRARAADVTRIAGHFEDLGQDVWLDRALSGGQEWWDTILDRIRSCDCFVFLVCEEGLQSRACRAELDYAVAADRTILPVTAGPAIPDAVLPRALSRLQHIDGGDAVQIARAMVNLPGARPLPSPLPVPPPVPISYMDELATALEREELSLAEQRDLLGALRERLSQAEDVPAAVTLLHRLRRRSDVFAAVADDVDAELARHAAPVAGADPYEPDRVEAAAPPVPPPPPAAWWPPGPVPPPGAPPMAEPPPRPRRSSGGRVAALVAAGVLVIAGAAGAAVALGGGDDDPPPVSSTTTDTVDGPGTTSPTTTGPDVTLDTVPVVVDELPDSYGDDQALDELSGECQAGDLVACDTLYTDSPLSSGYEAFGNTCGARVMLPFEGTCSDSFVEDYSDEVLACDGGDMVACDFLYSDSAYGSVYEAFGATCGLRTEDLYNGTCAVAFTA
jgi:hypothetical protein